MKDIAIIIPVHQLNNEAEKNMLINAIHNVKECQSHYKYSLNVYIVTPTPFNEDIIEGCNILINDGETDFCSQVNFGANSVTEDYFSIMEFDDEYNPKWFSMAEKYFYSNEDVSLFLPINIQIISKEGYRQFANETPWAISFSDELGYIDFKCLNGYYGFNITGGIFNRKDFVRIGGLNSSIQIAFNYELLRRMTNEELKVFVVPKEGYKHVIDRDGSLTSICASKYSQEEIDHWYKIAQKEWSHGEYGVFFLETDDKE